VGPAGAELLLIEARPHRGLAEGLVPRQYRVVGEDLAEGLATVFREKYKLATVNPRKSTATNALSGRDTVASAEAVVGADRGGAVAAGVARTARTDPVDAGAV
jgi:hypothetical protein